jgi:hypothetical protein
MRLRLLASVFVATVWLAIGAGVAVGAEAGAGAAIMPLSQVHAGLDCTGETVVKGTTISSFNVHVIDVVQEPGAGPRILVSVSGPAVDATGIAQGFSGSPVYCPDPTGKPLNAGAISAGVGEFGNKVGLVTPIEQMLGEPVKPPLSARRLSVPVQSLSGPLTVSGLAPSLASLLQEAGRRAGRVVLDGPAAPSLDFPLQPLVPGASVAVAYSRGEITIGGLGTVTYVDGGNVYAFGHPFDSAGRRTLLLEDAYVYDVVNNPNTDISTSYKLGAPGHVEGTVSADTPNAVIGQVGAGPPLIPVHVTAHDLDTGHRLAEVSYVADETDVGFPTGTALIDLVAPVAVAQGAIDVYDGAPASESGRLCFRVAIRESRKPLQFCNRYVGTGPPGGQLGAPEVAGAAMNDITSALGLLDRVQFASLHVTDVSATIDAQRGLRQATIVRATAPAVVRAGRNVNVSLLVRLYRGALRTITFPLRVPRNVGGRVTATLRGPGAGSSQSGPAAALGSLAIALGGGPAGPPAGGAPTSIAALRDAFAGVATYDGVQVSFGRRGEPDPAYRDPALLILGAAKLRFRVA